MLLDFETHIDLDKESREARLFMGNFIQARKYYKTQWTVESFDLVFGLIGGFVGLIWDSLGFFLGNYESFKFNTAIIGEIYSTSEAQRMTDGEEPDNLDDAMNDLNICLSMSGRYNYPYKEYQSTKFMLRFCCCFKKRACYKRREQRYKRQKLAEEQLAKETDFFKFLKLLRISNFTSKVGVRKYQRNLVPYFKKYQFPELEGDKKKSVFDTLRLGERA